MKAKILGFEVDKITCSELLDKIEEFICSRKPHKFAAVNPFYLLEARKYPEFAKYINECDIVTADGVGILFAGWLLGRPFPERVAGIDIFSKLIEKASRANWRLYFLGAQPGIAEKAYQNLKKKYHNLNVVGIHHGYFREDEEKEIVKDIKSKSPDILIVCLGVYRQEMFIQKYQMEMAVPVSCGLGGILDIYAGRFKRAPKQMEKVGLDWLFRLIQEPRRLWKRYLVGNTIFILLILREVIKILVLKRK